MLRYTHFDIQEAIIGHIQNLNSIFGLLYFCTKKPLTMKLKVSYIENSIIVVHFGVFKIFEPHIADIMTEASYGCI